MRSSRRYLTTRELAETLNVAPTTVRSWVARGQVGATRVGGRLRFQLSEVERLQVHEIWVDHAGDAQTIRAREVME